MSQVVVYTIKVDFVHTVCLYVPGFSKIQGKDIAKENVLNL